MQPLSSTPAGQVSLRRPLGSVFPGQGELAAQIRGRPLTSAFCGREGVRDSGFLSEQEQTHFLNVGSSGRLGIMGRAVKMTQTELAAAEHFPCAGLGVLLSGQDPAELALRGSMGHPVLAPGL